MSDPVCFDVSVSDRIAHLRMCRPERHNSMIREFWTELPRLVEEISAGSDARVIVVSAEGRNFSSGMDLGVFAAGGAAGPGEGGPEGHPSRRRANFRLTALGAQRAFNALETSRLPVIAAVQGACIGGGVDMVSACDLRYATDDAWFCIQEINIGMTADVGTLQRMPKLMPEGIVRELAFTGRKMPAAEAASLGFVSRVFPDADALLDGVMEVATEIAAKSPMAVWGTKQTMNYARDHSVADGLEYIAVWNAAMFDTDDMAEAFTARAEGRASEFPDHLPASDGI